MKRLGKAFAAAIMLVVFGVGSILAMPLVAAAIVVYAMTGSEWCEMYVGFRGKSFDQVVNTYWFNGHPKETVSSHAGRWLLALDAGEVKAVPLWVSVVDFVTDLAEKNHCRKSVEQAFFGMPL